MADDNTPPLDKFVFSAEQATITEKDLELRISALQTRIQRLSGKVEIKGMPIIELIMGVTKDKKELELIGNVLVRIAEPVAELTKLQQRKAVVDLAKDDPTWMLAAFGDFTEQLESLEPNKF